ncbi:hypothetical protein, partial [Thomasclavelia sp.]
ESQAAINEATQALSDAYSNLRIKPDESIIEDLRKFLDETKDLDYSKYSAATQIKIKNAICAVEKVLASKESSQKELLEASALVNEVRELIKHPDAKADSKETGAVTGDDRSIMIISMTLISSVVLLYCVNKRQHVK